MDKEPTQEEVRSTIMQLSQLLDLVGLEAYIEKRTDWGRRPGVEPWQYTRAALAEYAPGTDPEQVIQLFQGVGVGSDVEALRWILKHDELVP